MAKLKYPENLFFKLKFDHGDMTDLSKKSKISQNTIYAVLNGHRRLNDKLKKHIVKFLQDKQELNDSLNSVK